MDFYLDENLPEYLAQALNYLNIGLHRDIQVFSTIHKFGRGEQDSIIIPGIGNAGGILITKDLRIKRTNVLYHLCKKYKIGLYFLNVKDKKYWEIVKLIIKHWESIVDTSRKFDKPFAFIVSARAGVRRYD